MAHHTYYYPSDRRDHYSRFLAQFNERTDRQRALPPRLTRREIDRVVEHFDRMNQLVLRSFRVCNSIATRKNYQAVKCTTWLYDNLQMRAELRLRVRPDPTRYVSVTVAPGVREWLAHWNARLRRIIATADACVICMVEILHDRAARCPTCKKDGFHTACRIRWPSCPLCRRPDIFVAPWTFREFLCADGLEYDYDAFMLFK